MNIKIEYERPKYQRSLITTSCEATNCPKAVWAWFTTFIRVTGNGDAAIPSDPSSLEFAATYLFKRGAGFIKIVSVSFD